MKKIQKFGIFKGVDTKTHAFTGTATRKTVDRDGDVILPRALEARMPQFMKNPVMTWMHDQRRPVAKVTAYRISDDEVEFDGVFASEESEFAAEIERMYAGGFLNAFSIGFIPHGISRDPVMPGQTGLSYTDVELVEIACVSVPSNREALIKSMKMLEDEPAATLPGFESFPLADIDRAWDSVGAAERLKEIGGDLGRFKAGELEIEHHDVLNGRPVTVFRGVLAGLVALTSGKVQGTEEKLRAAYDHLVKHMKEFQREAPPFQTVKGISEAEREMLRDYHLCMAQAFGLKIEVAPKAPEPQKITDSDVEKVKDLAGRIESLTTTIGKQNDEAGKVVGETICQEILAA